MRLLKFKHYIFVAILSIIVGLILGYQIGHSAVEEQKDFTLRVINNCVNALEASRDISNSCSNAYQEAATCVTDLENCNVGESRTKLEQYNKEKVEAEERLRGAVDEAELILQDAEKLLD